MQLFNSTYYNSENLLSHVQLVESVGKDILSKHHMRQNFTVVRYDELQIGYRKQSSIRVDSSRLTSGRCVLKVSIPYKNVLISSELEQLAIVGNPYIPSSCLGAFNEAILSRIVVRNPENLSRTDYSSFIKKVCALLPEAKIQIHEASNEKERLAAQIASNSSKKTQLDSHLQALSAKIEHLKSLLNRELSNQATVLRRKEQLHQQGVALQEKLAKLT